MRSNQGRWAGVGALRTGAFRNVVCEPLEGRRLMAVGPIISEFVASNKTGLSDVDGDKSDWIEISNPSADPVALLGYTITDNAAAPTKWAFPDVTLPAGGRLVIFASDKKRSDPAGQLHTNFKLGAEGEYLGLFPPATTVAVSEFAPKFPAQDDDVSYGSLEGDPTALRFFTTPTPGAANVGGVGVVADTKFSVDRGFYDAPFDLAITSATAGATIKYTLDGSAPTPTHGTTYAGTIHVDGTSTVRAMAFRTGYQASNVDTQTYIFLDQVIHQPKNIDGWPNPVIPTDNQAAGDRVHDYEMDPKVVNNPAYSGSMIKALTDIPTMSLVVDQADMWDAAGQGGFYREDDVEKPVSVEVIYPNDPSKSSQADGGVEGHSHDRMKRSLRITFRTDEYGDKNLKTPLLQDAVNGGDSATDKFKRLVLRAGGNRSFTRGGLADNTTYAEDEWVRDTQLALTGKGVHGAFVHLYINGVYWGVYNPTERPDEHYSAEYYGGDNEDWFAASHDGAKDGDPARWNYLRGALKNKDMSVLSNYRQLEQYLDTVNFSDYLLAHFYAGVVDWPHNNFWLGNRTDEPGPVRFYSWDGEWSFGNKTSSLTSPPHATVHPYFLKNSPKTSYTDIPKIFNSAKFSPEFKMLFADRAYKATTNGGALTDAAAHARWDALTTELRDAVIAESARWGDTLSTSNVKTRDKQWQAEVTRIRNYMNGNAAYLIASLRNEGYYPSIEAPVPNQFGGTVGGGFALTLANPNSGGTIYYTLDGSDPRAVGGGRSANAVAYAGPITVDANVRVRARILKGTEWSTGPDVTFVTNPDAPVVVTPPASVTVDPGQPATFTVAATGPGPLTYQWQRNGADIDGATSDSYTLPAAAAADNGAKFRVVVTNDAGSATSAAATLTVNVPTPPPTFAMVKVNFQPAAAPTVSGYLVDSGLTYAARNGNTYGWTTAQADVLDRGVNANQLLDTRVALSAGSRWELAVPNGTYTVKVGAGDAGAASKANVWIEGVSTIAFKSLAANAFATATKTVTVTDGKLTVGVGSAATGESRLNYVEVTAGTTPPPPPFTPVKVNFQPTGAPTVAGYLVDAGAAYAARNGQTYGWSTAQADVLDRDVNADQLLDTRVAASAAAKWELAVPNGKYAVKVVAGDAGAASKANVWVEGVSAISFKTLAANVFATKVITVDVKDGKLTLGVGSAAAGESRFNYVEVSAGT